MGLSVPEGGEPDIGTAEARLKGENRKSLIEAAVRSVKVPVD